MQNRTTSPLPTEVHTETEISTHLRKPKIYIRLEQLFPPPTAVPRRRILRAVGGTAIACAVALLLWQGITKGGSGGMGGGLFHGILPPVPPFNSADTVTEDASAPHGTGMSSLPSEQTRPSEPPVTEESIGDDSTADTEEDSDRVSEAPTEEIGGTATAPSTEIGSGKPITPPDESAVPAESGESELPTEPDTEPHAEPDTVPDTESDTRPETETPPAASVPEDCFPITSLDMSDSARGAGYVINTAGALPPSLPAGSLWGGDTPTVLLVNTHPYEGYGDGTRWYDPAAGSLAVTETPYDPRGTVALGAALTRTLRGMGITVIHLRVAVSAGESSGEIYDRTESMIRYYCRLYPDIGLVLDLRRSAELTDDGGILRTAGQYGGASCAQLRISVSGGKNRTALGSDLATALALRRALWELEPTVSRPVWVKSGKGLIPELGDVRVLTLELGAAGNTYAEARQLLDPLGQAIAAILTE